MSITLKLDGKKVIVHFLNTSIYKAYKGGTNILTNIYTNRFMKGISYVDNSKKLSKKI